LPDGETRIGLKEIHHNRCPIVFAPDDAKTLGLKPDFVRLNIDLKQAQDIHAALHAASESIFHKLTEIYSKQREFDNSDPDGALYSGFFDRTDKAKFSKARVSKGQALLAFNDARLSELYFRYKARNWPESLNEEENVLWKKHKAERITPEHVQKFMAHCDLLITNNPDNALILQALKDWVVEISDE
jgi:exodeoxyribonuclease-1